MIPPVFEDNGKENNKFGDAIIWKEIIENCKTKNTENALFLSLDTIKDWVYSPLKVKSEDKTFRNDRSLRNYFILPWLEEEFTENVKGASITGLIV